MKEKWKQVQVRIPQDIVDATGTISAKEWDIEHMDYEKGQIKFRFVRKK